MQTAMKLTTSILAIAVMTGGLGAAQAAAQNPDAIDNARSLAKSLQQKQANDSNSALNAAGVPAAKPAPGAAGSPVAKPAAVPAKPKTAPMPKATAQPATAKKSAVHAKTTIAAKPSAAPAKPADGQTPKAENKKPEEKKWAMSGKRDPFFSPVVQQMGSSCSTGKKCLEIGAINVRGVVKSDSGFIAVVTNSVGKAYFLRENDPVFNGYVMRITGDSVVFEETIEDKLGKPFTREVVKRLTTPAV
jgi:Tfp pilus assembly protein PilP